jgi:hypothetical protein
VLVVLTWAAGGTETVRSIVPIRHRPGRCRPGAGRRHRVCIDGVGGEFPRVRLRGGGPPAIGEVKAVSPLAFDSGVYLTVLGMSVGLVRAFGDDLRLTPEGADMTIVTLAVASVHCSGWAPISCSSVSSPG